MYNTSLRIVNRHRRGQKISCRSHSCVAFEEIENYSGTESFGTWLNKRVQNRSLDILRKRIK